ncbi:MAG: ABC transporter ATP-binding protein [Deinococcota bacterium]
MLSEGEALISLLSSQSSPQVHTQTPAHTRDLVLDIQRLRTHYFLEKGTVKALDGVDLQLKRNSTLGLVGESGSGKSVTARSIMRIIKSPPGKIVDGEIWLHRDSGNGTRKSVDLTKLDPRGADIRNIRGKEVSMIFQEPMTSLNPLHTVSRQIGEVVRLHQNVNKKEAEAVALEMLQKVQISDAKTRLKQYPHQLSGGMRQRVMIALALSCNPAILLADEPTTALDVTVQAQILDLMQGLKDEFNSAIVLITHNLGVVSQMADHIAVMYFGKIVEYGTVQDVFHNPQHPYTVGLLQSIPVFGKKSHSKLVPIRGMVPSATTTIQGCAFAARCPYASAKCQEPPPLIESNGHKVACWLAQS